MSEQKPPTTASDIAQIVRNVSPRNAPVLMTGLDPYQSDIPSDFRTVLDVAERAIQHTARTYWQGNAALDFILRADWGAMRKLRRAHNKALTTTKRSW